MVSFDSSTAVNLKRKHVYVVCTTQDLADFTQIYWTIRFLMVLSYCVVPPVSKAER